MPSIWINQHTWSARASDCNAPHAARTEHPPQTRRVVPPADTCARTTTRKRAEKRRPGARPLRQQREARDQPDPSPTVERRWSRPTVRHLARRRQRWSPGRDVQRPGRFVAEQKLPALVDRPNNGNPLLSAPESWAVKWPLRSASPTRSSASSCRIDRRAISVTKAMLCSVVRLGAGLSSWKTKPP